jgi:hypothetical protein
MATPVSSVLYHVTQQEFTELLAYPIIFHNVTLTGLNHMPHEKRKVLYEPPENNEF